MTDLWDSLKQLRALRDELRRERDRAKSGMPTRKELRGRSRELVRLLPTVVDGERAAVVQIRELVQTVIAQVNVEAGTPTVHHYALPLASGQVGLSGRYLGASAPL